MLGWKVVAAANAAKSAEVGHEFFEAELKKANVKYQTAQYPQESIQRPAASPVYSNHLANGSINFCFK